MVAQLPPGPLRYFCRDCGTVLEFPPYRDGEELSLLFEPDDYDPAKVPVRCLDCYRKFCAEVQRKWLKPEPPPS